MSTWIEKLESRSIQSSGGRGTGTRTFFASGYTDIKQVFNSFGKTIGGLEVPEKGSSHPDFQGLVARDFTIAPVDGHSDLWRVDWAYEMVTISYFSSPGTGVNVDTLPNEVGYVELSSEIRAEFALRYREDAATPRDGDPGEPDYGDPEDPDNDIGGRPIDMAGNPTSVIRRIQELTLTETVNAPAFGIYGSFRFVRNSKPFLGADVGRVLYRGASVRRTGLNVYVVSHSFVDDEFYHLEQQPLLDQDGRPALNDEKKASKVSWVQPFSAKADLYGISSQFAGL